MPRRPKLKKLSLTKTRSVPRGHVCKPKPTPGTMAELARSRWSPADHLPTLRRLLGEAMERARRAIIRGHVKAYCKAYTEESALALAVSRLVETCQHRTVHRTGKRYDNGPEACCQLCGKLFAICLGAMVGPGNPIAPRETDDQQAPEGDPPADPGPTPKGAHGG